MTANINPFEYCGANDLPDELIHDYYIEDFNYSRFIRSKRNIFLVGDRGCGKSMALLYYSWPIERLKAERKGADCPYDYVGVYIPCNTPLTHKTEYQLLGDYQAALISEHFLVLSIAYAIADTLSSMPTLTCDDETRMRERLQFILRTELPPDASLFEAIKDFINREIGDTQRAINRKDSPEVSYENTFSFASLIVPVLGCTRQICELRESHFMLLIDDAHDLNIHQRAALNAWVAYREHSLFSFKVAVARVAPEPGFKTSSGGSILEGHDFTRIDMLQPYHNLASDFGRLARLIVNQRLKTFRIVADSGAFFPVSERLQADLNEAREAARREAQEKYGAQRGKAIDDHVYKYARAHYFRSRSPRANRPEYSGFDTLVFLSTGVIRNLLIPCYWMYDRMLSLQSLKEGRGAGVATIPPAIQSEAILERSRALWRELEEGLDQTVTGCTREDALRAYRLMDNLALHFRERLLQHRSEPRANSFTVSSWTDLLQEKLIRIFDILEKAQLLYVRSGPAKDRGRREPYYIPNRLLWPERGLDPHGQHARVSLPAHALWAAADKNEPLPFKATDDSTQQVLFDE